MSNYQENEQNQNWYNEVEQDIEALLLSPEHEITISVSLDDLIVRVKALPVAWTQPVRVYETFGLGSAV